MFTKVVYVDQERNFISFWEVLSTPKCWAEPPMMARNVIKSEEKSDFIRILIGQGPSDAMVHIKVRLFFSAHVQQPIEKCNLVQ